MSIRLWELCVVHRAADALCCPQGVGAAGQQRPHLSPSCGTPGTAPGLSSLSFQAFLFPLQAAAHGEGRAVSELWVSPGTKKEPFCSCSSSSAAQRVAPNEPGWKTQNADPGTAQGQRSSAGALHRDSFTALLLFQDSENSHFNINVDTDQGTAQNCVVGTCDSPGMEPVPAPAPYPWANQRGGSLHCPAPPRGWLLMDMSDSDGFILPIFSPFCITCAVHFFFLF